MMIPKFRAWYKHLKLMLTVTALFVEEGYVEAYIDKEAPFDTTLELDLDTETVLLRSTGLTDTTGKEIYAGDVLESKDGRRIVIVDKGLHFEADSGDYGLVLCPGHVEGKRIVGNIYENGELVDVGND